MSTAHEAPAIPPIDALLGETAYQLALAASSYLAPQEGPPDLAAASLACDAAGDVFARIAPRLRPEERNALRAMLTDLRLSVVKKRG
jgi:hypothetical protein